MIAAHAKSDILTEEKAILRVLLYFDIFDYPLTENEIVRFSPVPLLHQRTQILTQLIDQKLIFKVGDFFSVQQNPALGTRRAEGNRLAKIRLKTAEKYSHVIAKFPFVKAVLLSGSISKGFMDMHSDIDYFIITAPERLWIVRTLLVIFRRLFLFNSRKYFCTNYFIDTNNLTIPDQNYFTAVELDSLIPMYGTQTIQELKTANKWISNFLVVGEEKILPIKEGNYFVKRFLENILSGNFFTKLNTRLMAATIRFWKKKYGSQINAHDFQIAFRSQPGVSKSHPQFFQKKVLNRLEQKIKLFEANHGVDLNL